MYRREAKPEIRLVTGIRDFRCGLDPFRYYDRLLRNLPAEEEKQKAFDYTSHFPWSERIPERLRAGHPETEEKKD